MFRAKRNKGTGQRAGEEQDKDQERNRQRAIKEQDKEQERNGVCEVYFIVYRPSPRIKKNYYKIILKRK